MTPWRSGDYENECDSMDWTGVFHGRLSLVKAAQRSGFGLLHPRLAGLTALICGLAACWGQSPMPDSFDPEAIGFFNPMLGGQQSSLVSALALQPDGKVLVAGQFASLGGLGCTNFGRLNPDGSLDTDFLSAIVSNGFSPSCFALQPDGKLVLGSAWLTGSGQPATNLARFKPDGTLDSSFTPTTNRIRCLVVQPDGKILASSSIYDPFSIERFNPNGSLDTNFNPILGLTNALGKGVALQPDGKILVSGMVTRYGIPLCIGLVRLNPDGTPDSGFNSVVIGGTSQSIECATLQADGKILVGGWFTSIAGLPATNLARLYADGTVDTNFSASTDMGVTILALQADGKILVGGYFSVLDGAPNSYLGRLNTDGSLDTSFAPQVGFFPPNGSLYLEPFICSLAAQPDGKLLVGGVYSSLGGQTRTCIGRLNSTGPVTNSVSLDESGITWSRGGDGPEVWRTSFDSFTSEAGWVSLGAGVRFSDGWQLIGIPVPTNATIRARGYIGSQAGIDGNGSSWFVETVLGPPVLALSWNNGLPVLTLTGEAGRQYDLQFAPTLTSSNSWQSLTNLSLLNTEQSFVDSAIAAQRFYRAVMSQ